MAANANRTGRWKRLEVIVNLRPMASTASIGSVTIRNLDAGGAAGEGVIGSKRLDALHEIFETLGFRVNFAFSPPTTGV